MSCCAGVPRASVVVLTSFSDQQRVAEALEAGAVGYLLKDCDPRDLLAAVRSAAEGHAPLDPRVARRAAARRPRPQARPTAEPRARRRCCASSPRAWRTNRSAAPRHQRAHGQGPPRARLPRDRRPGPDQRRPLGPASTCRPSDRVGTWRGASHRALSESTTHIPPVLGSAESWSRRRGIRLPWIGAVPAAAGERSPEVEATNRAAVAGRRSRWSCASQGRGVRGWWPVREAVPRARPETDRGEA